MSDRTAAFRRVTYPEGCDGLRGTGGPGPASGRGIILKALLTGHTSREAIVCYFRSISDLYKDNAHGQRAAIVDVLGKEHKQQTPLWTQHDAEYALTDEGEALRNADTPTAEAEEEDGAAAAGLERSSANPSGYVGVYLVPAAGARAGAGGLGGGCAVAGRWF